jgi:hypothetical protein
MHRWGTRVQSLGMSLKEVNIGGFLEGNFDKKFIQN